MPFPRANRTEHRLAEGLCMDLSSDASMGETRAHDTIMIPMRNFAWCRAAGIVVSVSVDLASGGD